MCGMEKTENTAGGVGMFGGRVVRNKSAGLALGVREMEMEMKSLRKKE